MMLLEHGRPAPTFSPIAAGHEPACLLVDDVLYVSFLAEVFRARGYRVLTAATGKAALRIAERHAPAFVLLDVAMPRLDGLEVLHALRRHDATRSTLVVMLSGRGRTTDILDARHGGADDHIMKPIRPNDLVARVEALLRPGG
jgi:DNA-binding response OmpR family regulator